MGYAILRLQHGPAAPIFFLLLPDLGAVLRSPRIWGIGRARHPWGSRVRARSSIQSVTGRTTGGFPLLQLWRPKALEHCGGTTERSRQTDGEMARAKGQRAKRHWRKETQRNHRSGRKGPPRVCPQGVTTRPRADSVSGCKQHCKASQGCLRALLTHAVLWLSVRPSRADRPAAVLTYPPTASP